MDTETAVKLLAQATAGSSMKPRGPGGGTVRNVNLVMGALGMGRAGRAPTLVLLGNYCEDQQAARMAQVWLLRWAWLAWLHSAPAGTRVTVRLMKALVKLAWLQHTRQNWRNASLADQAKFLGVNHQTFKAHFQDHLRRCRAELQYQEASALGRLAQAFG